MIHKNCSKPALRLGLASSLALLSLGCGDAPSLDAPELMPLGSRAAALWQSSTARLWSNIIPVCFQPSVSTADRTFIRDVINQGWGRAANLAFTGWGTCTGLNSSTQNLIVVAKETPAGNVNGRSVSCTGSAASTCSGQIGKAVNGDYNRVQFNPNSFPSDGDLTNFVVLHEFGHALGLLHETNDGSTFCDQRTSGGQSLEGEQDGTYSVMSAYDVCVPHDDGLSSWDIMGIRRMYGGKPSGMLAGAGNLTLNIQGGETTVGANIIGWPASGHSWNSRWNRTGQWWSHEMAATSPNGTQRGLNVQGGVVGAGFTNVVSWNGVGSWPGAQNMKFEFPEVEWIAMGDRCVQAETDVAGAELGLERCTGSALQRWSVLESEWATSSNRIKLAGTNLCVGVPGGSTALGTKVILESCFSTENELFTMIPGGLIGFENRVFNIAGGTVASGNRVVLWSPASGGNYYYNDKFSVRGHLESVLDFNGAEQCVDMEGAAAPGVNIGVRPCTARNSSRDNTQNWDYHW